MVESDWITRASKLFCICLWGLAAYVALKYFGSILMPILVAFAVSAAVWSVSKKFAEKTGISKRICAAALVTLLLLAVSFILFYVCSKLINEIKELVLSLPINTSDLTSSVVDILIDLPFLSSLAEESAAAVSFVLVKLLNAMVDSLSALLANIFAATPSTLLSVVVSIISCYYMSVDFEGIVSSVLGFIPRKAHSKLLQIKNGALSAALGYLKAYAKLFLITFCESLVGLLVLCPQYALIGAICIAAVDILPVFGAGMVLIPWGIAQIVLKRHLLGCGLLVLYLVMTVIRQIIEPRILGGAVGISPLEAILLMFVGYRVFGVGGMMMLPLLFSVVKKIKFSGKLT